MTESERKIRVIIAKPGLDGHDRGREDRRAGPARRRHGGDLHRHPPDAGDDRRGRAARGRRRRGAEHPSPARTSSSSPHVLRAPAPSATSCPPIRSSSAAVSSPRRTSPGCRRSASRASSVRPRTPTTSSTSCESASPRSHERWRLTRGPAARCPCPDTASQHAAALVAGLRAGNRRALAQLLTEVENGTPAGREGLRRLFADTGRAHTIGITGAPGLGQEHRHQHARAGLSREGTRPSPSSPSTPPARSPRARSWATACACRISAADPRHLHPQPRLARGAGRALARHGSTSWRCSTRPAATSSSSRPSAPARTRSRIAGAARTTVLTQHPRRRRRHPGHEGRASWRSPTCSASTRPTTPAPTP